MTTQTHLPFTPACAHCGKTEEWRDVPEYEGSYQVSSLGRVRSLARVIEYVGSKGGKGSRIACDRIMRLASNPLGYLRVVLCRPGSHRSYFAHRLVAAAFIGPCPDGMVIDHINHDPADNRPENLRYCTLSQNAANSVTLRGDLPFKGVRVTPWGRFKASVEVNFRRLHLGTFDTAEEAARAYDAAATQHFGKFAALNFPNGDSRVNPDFKTRNLLRLVGTKAGK